MNIQPPTKLTQRGLDSAATMKSHKLGSWFEQKLQDRFKFLKQTTRFDYLRLYDTKSAGAYLPSQAGDFMIASPRGVVLVEAKASATHGSLRSCLSSNVSAGQATDHIMWNRAGQKSLFIFLSVPDGVLEVWDGGLIAKHRNEGKRLTKKERPFVQEYLLGAPKDTLLSILENGASFGWRK